LYLWAAADVWRHVRNGMRQRWGWLYAAPMLLAALMLALRCVRAAVSPDTVTFEVEQNTVLSVGSSITGLVAALLLQMMLVSLLVSRLVGRLERLSRHDPLTGLLNRRAMGELLTQEEQRVRRLAGPNTAGQIASHMTVLMIDIDHFKQLNDTQGHAAGDRALQHLATVMGSQLRDIDHLARWGGEEFLALLPATSSREALALAERLCERVRSMPLVNEGQRLLLTASVGVADWLGPHDNLTALLGRADAALYAAKHGGRDRVSTGPALRPLQAIRSA
jgi:diguanylate cyclase (GGDEF)-like protein